jgi:hypothetical protein
MQHQWYIKYNIIYNYLRRYNESIGSLKENEK